MPIVNGIRTVLPDPGDYPVDFDNPRRQAVPHAYWIASVGTILSLLMMIQRLYTKTVVMGRLQLDDAFLILAWLMSMATVGLCVHMFATGAGGVHGWEIDIPTYNIYLMDVYLAAAIYIVGGSFAKASLLIFYLRLSPQTWFKISVWATLVFISGYTVGIFFALIFACDPIAKSYDATVVSGTCINRPTLYIATAVVNILSDIQLFFLPLPFVVKLQVPRRQKLGLVVIFLLGSITIVTSVIRVSILPQMLTSVDQTWVISWASVWIIVEANLFIVCGALPTIRKFLKHVAPTLIGETRCGRSSKATKDVKSTSEAIALRTIGTMTTKHGGAKRNQYSQFEDIDSEFTQGRRDIIMVSEYSVSSGMVGESGEEQHWADDSSEKALKESGRIRRTQTVTVD
ncbi:uncharacterized protein F5Z01DRAFT_668148 [Emericellopsis atlantica]|uniref:Integral membrane protein n=1 Tax=Emericellopsis atlantica TaxID=2614577 RepID=A0A9P8CJY4_9HYPO|nr:uncharacterized protein F5Z01DRAFT_668148 [Emericellopsis atlantica]KAG9249808.1 integral membrane protein [Emericellopsis atlantica]